MIELSPSQDIQGDEAQGAKAQGAKAKVHKVLATAEFINSKPAHDRYVTKAGSGSSLRVACKDAVDAIFKTPKAKSMRSKLPFKIVFQSGE